MSGMLLQDSIGDRECRRLCLWFASRLDSMWLIRAAAAIGKAMP